MIAMIATLVPSYPAFAVLTKATWSRPIALTLVDYGSLDDPQSQPPAGTSVAAQNVSVPFV
jgi:hypothetical protein